MLGLLIQKTYIHYPYNPVSDTAMVNDYLEYAREKYVPVGVAERAGGINLNHGLEINAVAAGGVIHQPMVEWFLRENIHDKVIVDGLSLPDLREVEMIATGFTPLLVWEMNNLIEAKARCCGARAIAVNDPIPVTSGWRDHIVWSKSDDRCVSIKREKVHNLAIWG
jgi:hypothetical protein